MNPMEIEFLNGIRIFLTDMITKDVQARKHRKKRINKKWAKRYGCKTVPDDTKVIMTEDTLFMTKRCFQKIKRQLENDGNINEFVQFQKCEGFRR